MSGLSKRLRESLNVHLRQRGYALKWFPPEILNSPGKLIDVDFAMLAAQLMLRHQQPYFIGIGANDGVTHDPLYPFIRDFGWRGLMVEPIPEAFMALERNYTHFSAVTLVQAAIGATDGKGKIYSVEMTEPNSLTMSLHSSFDKNVLLRGMEWHPGLDAHVVERVVPIMSFRTLLSKTQGNRVDVLKIDTEGYDLEILKTIDFSTFSPELILAEHANLPKQGKIDMAHLLLRHGYRVAMTSLDMLGYKLLLPEQKAINRDAVADLVGN